MVEQTIAHIAHYLQALTKKEFHQYLSVAVSVLIAIVIGTSYYIHNTSSSLKSHLERINTLSAKATQLIKQNDRMAQEIQYVRTLLNNNKTFNMSTDFEEFCKRNQVTPEAGWKAEVEEKIEGSDFEEVILRATFKNQTMQKLVELLQDIYKKEMVYLKGLEITNEGKKITLELTLATKQYKIGTEEGKEEGE